MTDRNTDEPLTLNDKPMGAWEEAAAMGIGMRILEYTLSLTPDERLRFHDSKLKLFLMLERRAGDFTDGVKSS